ncbi:hypothetical protein [Clostridium oryzae]|nr:hypothetical protein [Clostridium oryzae]
MNKKINISERTIVIISCIILSFIALRVLFIKPLIGMADNGDFFREINNAGLYYLSDNYKDRHFGYFNRLYGIRQYLYESNDVFISSLFILIKIALFINKIFISGKIFDLRVLAILYFSFFILAFFMIMNFFSKIVKKPVLLVMVSLTIFIFGDIGYLAYFNSFYGEPASYVFFFLMLGIVFKISDENSPRLKLFIFYTIVSTIFITAKQQNTPTIILLLILNTRILTLRKSKLWKLIVAAGTAVIVVASICTYALITQNISHINKYHAYTRGILSESSDQEKDTEALGLNKKFTILNGTTYYDKYFIENPESKRMNEEFYKNLSYFSIIKYYLTHIDKLSGKLNMAAKNSFIIRPDAIGNYEKAYGNKYGGKTYFFTAWSSIKCRLFPRNFKFILFFYASFYGMLMKAYIEGFIKKDLRLKMIIEILAIVGVIGIMQFGISFLGAGDADISKHLFLFNVCFDCMLISQVIFIFSYIYQRFILKKR